MEVTEKLENKVKEMSGSTADEILAAVKELAAVDVEIKNALDEIERIKDGLPEKHNLLADKINRLVEEVANGEPKGKHEKEDEPKPEPDPEVKKVRVHVQVVKAPPVPVSMMMLMNWLLS